MSTENRLQEFVHKLEQGGWSGRIQGALLLAAVLYVASLWLFNESGFKGFSHEKAMEQAQIARELARGHGFSTKMIRPAALWQFESNQGSFPSGHIPDTFHAPLNPWINSFFLRLTEDSWTMAPGDIVYTSDRLLVGVQLMFYLLSVAVTYFTAKRLFDHRLAVFTVCLLLLCERLWDFSMSGLPQMLLLFLFSCAAHVMVRAIEARFLGKSTLPFSAALGALFGLLALTHSLTLFLLAGALIFALVYFRPFGRDALIIVGVCALLYSPWLVRNYMVCGNPLGMAWYANLADVCGSESKVMRTLSLDALVQDITPRNFARKLRLEFMDQVGRIYWYLGSIVVAPAFFVALLHVFRKPETAAFRWWILSMWLAGCLGMAVAGLSSDEHQATALICKANDLHVLFIPLMCAYGMAFIMVLWSRLEIHLRLFRLGFLGLIFLLSAIPFISQGIDLIKAPRSRVQWPPYVPPFISILGQWTAPEEVIMSDMPWAVAWYADRKCLWLPMSIDEFISLNDYKQLGVPIVGLYLTPISGNKSFISEISKGEFKDWAPFITRQVNQANLRDFPLHSVIALPLDNECVFYADRERWQTTKP